MTLPSTAALPTISNMQGVEKLRLTLYLSIFCPLLIEAHRLFRIFPLTRTFQSCRGVGGWTHENRKFCCRNCTSLHDTADVIAARNALGSHRDRVSAVPAPGRRSRRRAGRYSGSP